MKSWVVSRPMPSTATAIAAQPVPFSWTHHGHNKAVIKPN
jgi:hypothetical protein